MPVFRGRFPHLAICCSALAAASTAVPEFNNSKCPAWWELQAPHMATDFRIEELEGDYYELAFHDTTQYPLCPQPPRCITSEKRLRTHSDGVRFVNDTWNLNCFGRPTPQDLLFNVTDVPGHLRGYVPKTNIPFLPPDIVSNVVFPDTIVDFKPGPQGWSLEVQCVEWKDHVIFVGINYYSKVNSEANFQEMDRSARARGLGLWLDHGFGLKQVNFTGCPPLRPDAEDARDVLV